jgi:methyl coenzyme M reductase subunit D
VLENTTCPILPDIVERATAANAQQCAAHTRRRKVAAHGARLVLGADTGHVTVPVRSEFAALKSITIITPAASMVG